MSKQGWTAGIILLLGIALLPATGALLGGAEAGEATSQTGGKGEVIMMRCSIDQSRFKVVAFEGSPSAPVKKSEICPEELSLLLKEGFTIRDAIHSDFDQKFAVYLLVR